MVGRRRNHLSPHRANKVVRKPDIKHTKKMHNPTLISILLLVFDSSQASEEHVIYALSHIHMYILMALGNYADYIMTAAAHHSILVIIVFMYFVD